MEPLICLSQNFINKQNVRSYVNIRRHGLLNTEPIKATESITPELRTFLTEMDENLKLRCKGDFKEYFNDIDSTQHLEPVGKQVIFQRTWRALCDIIPKRLFGDYNQNKKKFRRLVEATIYSMRHQHFKLGKFVNKWDFASLGYTNDPRAKEILYHILKWILQNILSPILALNFYVTTCKTDSDENKLHFFWKSHWQSFYDRKIFEMIYTETLQKCESYCLSKKIKTNHSLSERLRFKSQKKEIPKLHLILKRNKNYRPIVQYKAKVQNTTDKHKIKDRLNFLKILMGRRPKKIDTLYSEFYEKWLKSNKPKLYFVKTDLSNAFGAVNKDKLLKILYEKHAALQKTEKNLYLKKKYAQQFNDIMAELRKPLLVRAGSTVYEWKQGLVQGYKYSPALSELYYNQMDETYFSEHLMNSTATIKLFIRVVDDYLYITDTLEDGEKFLSTLANYRNVNYGKTEVNFPHPEIKLSEEITFLGNSYNTKNLQVSRASTAFEGPMCFKIAFTGAIADVNKFLEKRISQSGIPINSHIFNFFYNPEKLIWSHIFTTFCLSANKFCTTLAIACDETEMVSHLKLYKQKVAVKLSNSIVETLLKNKPVGFKFIFCGNHLQYLSWQALFLCAKGTPKCSGLIPSINDELSRTNCLFGKWTDHFSAVSSNGEMLQTATKEVCRRTDLRMLVKNFTKLPMGFECYNHRKIVNQNSKDTQK